MNQKNEKEITIGYTQTRYRHVVFLTTEKEPEKVFLVEGLEPGITEKRASCRQW